ncbi:MAG: Glycosyl hydrolase BNR repeat-containing protein [Candidatus Giovannonibacteria bacterium GW2011_GWA2_53_7]|uniref:Glycosyl hydrolase BNR repeat-containing protein n=1 Tax=Candidatus Giovannonibacteria bacterium GW2011_GWA2_53_7 TaxID=1618650 RepID=A0A0G1Y1U6_9BACT|nr:MAG: Glycosyl hydrolase BNR repeat-containing protein [Candidatus Giovannonibacteria bacterium GW2011_GWA2_53_7]
MKRSSLCLISLLAVLVFAGAGCFSKGEVNTSTDGGVWKSVDGAVSWQQAVAIPTSSGVSSAAGTNILALAVDPNDPDALYAGLTGDGMLYSYDGATSWQQPRDASVRTGAVTSVAVDPSNKCRVYVARGERIFKTEDCNRSFEEIYVETKGGVIVTMLAVDWFSTDSLYAAFSDGTILKSSDRGARWAISYRGRQAVTSLIVSHADSRVLLAGMAGTGIARSQDGGSTWEVILDPLRPYRDAARVVAITQDATGSAIYVATYYGILRSFDQGTSWEPLELLTAPNQVIPSAVAVDPGHPNILLYGVDNSLYRTEDGGANWSVQKLPTTRAISTILFHRTQSNIVYLGVIKREK